MKPSLPFQPIVHSVGIKDTERWNIYHRLQQLEIPCHCSTNQPLEVELNSPGAIAQLCFVVKQLTAPRNELIEWLNGCWEIETNSQRTLKQSISSSERELDC